MHTLFAVAKLLAWTGRGPCVAFAVFLVQFELQFTSAIDITVIVR